MRPENELAGPGVEAVLRRRMHRIRETGVKKAARLAQDEGPAALARGMKMRRRRLGLSQQQLADRIGATKCTLQDWEHGRHWPSGYYLPLLAGALDCGIEELFLAEGEEDG